MHSPRTTPESAPRSPWSSSSTPSPSRGVTTIRSTARLMTRIRRSAPMPCWCRAPSRALWPPRARRAPHRLAAGGAAGRACAQPRLSRNGPGSGGNAVALSVARRNDATSRSEVGFRLDGQASLSVVPVTGFARAAWAHDFERDASLFASLAALPGASFTASGAPPTATAP